MQRLAEMLVLLAVALDAPRLADVLGRSRHRGRTLPPHHHGREAQHPVHKVDHVVPPVGSASSSSFLLMWPFNSLGPLVPTRSLADDAGLTLHGPRQPRNDKPRPDRAGLDSVRLGMVATTAREQD